jgi:N-acetylglutamate synthase-like GNAT family acetyltransferase
MTEQTRAASEIHVAKDEAAVRECFPVFRELRPHLRSEDELIERWRKQLPEGYEIIFIQEEGKVVAAAGYRFFHTMAWGSILYLDDLVVAPSARGSGLGAALLQYVQKKAKEHSCDSVHLDTGYQRYLAHKSYLRNGFYLQCHHMAWEAKGTK